MRFVSDITGQTYRTVEACQKAEQEFLAWQKEKADKDKQRKEAEAKAKAEREAKEKARGERAKEVEHALKHAQEVRAKCQKEIAEADENYNKLLNAFLHDYQQFHLTLKGSSPLQTMIDAFFSEF